jgi:hypothetical protein
VITQAANFITPSFPGFPSGHSTFSRAAADVLTEFTRSPFYPQNLNIVEPAGKSSFEPACASDATNCTFVQCATDSTKNSANNFEPKADVTLNFRLFREMSNQAGRSRIYGGIHIGMIQTFAF